VIRLLRLWRVYATLDLLFVTRNLRSLLIYYLSDAILIAASVSATLLLAERFEGIGVWSKRQVVFMLGYAMLTDADLSMFFTYNVAFVSRRIARGQFDPCGVVGIEASQIMIAIGGMPADPCTRGDQQAQFCAHEVTRSDEQHLAALHIQEHRQIAHQTLAFPNLGVD